MVKLLIVDDESFAREILAQIIPWQTYGVELIGTAWNGVEAAGMIREGKPDIVFTDIKMPGMNGIELIRQMRQEFPKTEFVVISGYGEYEHTSQAMAEGVQYYILKPFDEAKIVDVLQKVKAKLQQKQHSETVLDTALPHAEEQIFRSLLLGREVSADARALFAQSLPRPDGQFRLIAFRCEDAIPSETVAQTLADRAGEARAVPVLLTTILQTDIVCLTGEGSLPAVIAQLQGITQSAPACVRRIAVTDADTLWALHPLYKQTKELLRIGEADQSQGMLLYYDLFRDRKETADRLVDYRALEHAQTYAQIFFECRLLFLKLAIQETEPARQAEICSWILQSLCGKTDTQFQSDEGCESSFQQLATALCSHRGLLPQPGGREEERGFHILLLTYFHLPNPELNLQYLARDVLYINEEHLGRVFTRHFGVKFSDYLLHTRIALAKRILQYQPDLHIATLAPAVGFSPDGQYFSKAFKKIVGASPKAYRQSLLDSKTED